MNILVGGLFPAICYRWPFIGLILLMTVAAGFIYGGVDQNPVEQVCLTQDWSPTAVDDVSWAMSGPGNIFFSRTEDPPAVIIQKLPAGNLR